MFSSVMIVRNSKTYMLYIFATFNSKTFLNQDHLVSSAAVSGDATQQPWERVWRDTPLKTVLAEETKPRIRAHRCKRVCQDGELFMLKFVPGMKLVSNSV